MSSEKKRIYPTALSRQNYNLIIYSDIALRSYVRAKQQYETLDFSLNEFEEDISFDMFLEYTISTIVFSAMCIEAFLNDYAASCLGDEEFYGYFDKLSIEGKFALVAKFVLATEIDKSKSYYSRLKSLIRDRNKYTHSKSTTLEGYSRLEDILEVPMEELSAWEKDGIDPKPYQDMLKSAREGLLAIRDIACFFDEHDASANAIARLFCIGGAIPDADGKDIRENVLHELHIDSEVVKV